MEDLDKKIIILINKLYKMDDNQNKEFETILKTLANEEKIDIAYSLWKKVKEEENIISNFLRKVKLLKNDLEDYKEQDKAEELLTHI